MDVVDRNGLCSGCSVWMLSVQWESKHTWSVTEETYEMTKMDSGLMLNI